VGSDRQPFVMMIEDNRGDALLFQEALRERDSSVTLVVARSVDEGIRSISELADAGRLPCLILVDLHMPRQDGRAFLNFLAGDGRFTGVPAIMLTSSQRVLDRDECLRLGAAAFRVKPCDWTSYLELVDSFKAYWSPQP
jgi:CheY-like chemotaxis protein